MWLNLVEPCDTIFPARSPQAAMEWLFPGPANEAKAAGEPVPGGAEARQNLDLEKESFVLVGVDADSVKTDLIGGSRVGNALAKEGCCMAGKLKMPHQVARKVYRGTVGQAE